MRWRAARLDRHGGLGTIRKGRNTAMRGHARQFAEEVQQWGQTERLRVMQEAPASVADGIIIADAQGRLVFVNEAAKQMARRGLAPEALLREQRTPLPPRYPGGRAVPHEEMGLARALRGERVADLVVLIRRPDGSDAYVSNSAQPIRDEQGRIIAAVVSFREITDRRRADREREELLADVQAQRELFQTVVEHAPAGIAAVRAPNWVHDLVNRAYQAIAPGKPMLGKSVAEVWPELAPEVLPLLERVLRTGKPYHATDAPIRIRRAPEAPLEAAYFTFSFVPVRIGREQHKAILVLAIETTDHVRAQQKIEHLAAEAQRRAGELQSILDNMVDGVFVSDARGQVTLANEAGVRLLGLRDIAEAKRALAKFPALLRLRHLDGRPIVAHELPLVRALAGQVIVHEFEILYDARAARDVYVRSSAAPIRDTAGSIVGAVEVARDVTELTELERLKDEFISIAAHELKTPVAIMKGYTQALLRRADDVTPAGRRMLEAIDRGSNRIDAVVKDLLDVSKLHAGPLELAVGPVDLPALISQCIDRIALTTTKHNIRLIEAEPVVVHGDLDRLEQVVMNLLDNAVKYSPKGGDIDVAVAVKGKEAVVSVQDRGVGIPKEKQGRIFQRFYSAHTNTPFDYGGMGVGLYISKEIITRHGGRMGFESQEGKGSTFYFSLPVA